MNLQSHKREMEAGHDDRDRKGRLRNDSRQNMSVKAVQCFQKLLFISEYTTITSGISLS